VHSGEPEDLVGRIYEAAAVPELWPEVLEGLSVVADALGTALLTADAQNMKWILTESVRGLAETWLAEGWHLRNERMPRLLERQHAGFLRAEDVFTAEEMEASTEMREFWRARGMGGGLGTAISVPSGDTLVFSIERERVKGPPDPETVRRLDALRPHLARAALLSARLGLERAKLAADVLATVGLPAAILGRGGRLLATNHGLEPYIPGVIRDLRGRLSFAAEDPDRLFASALERLRHVGPAAEPVASIPLPAEEGHPPLIFHLLPVRGAGHDIFSQAEAVLIVTPVEPRKVPTAQVLGGLFDLTPAEARVARHIGEGKATEAIAKQLGVGVETVRTQVRAILRKTGMARRIDLAALLAGVSRSL
jgi:DNA-binding CsgD family transcriptional regulator